MANYLKFTYQHIGEDSTTTTFTDVDHAKTLLTFDNWNFTGRTPQWTLEDSNQTLALTIFFTDAEAHREMKTFHENVKDNWPVIAIDGVVNYNINNAYIINNTPI